LKSIKEQLDPIFKPRSIAVIGASGTPMKWGFRMLDRPIRTGFRGTIYPVNIKGETMFGLPTYKRILDVPGPVDLAIMTIPAKLVPIAMKECVEKKVGGVVVITAGFSEVDEQGGLIETEAVNIARQGNIRFVGPNCMGIWSSESRLNLSFEKAPRSGPISFISQSGTFGVFLSEMANARGYGLSKFVSIGNQADLNAADYLEYLATDENTQVIVFYMEGFKEGRRFFDLAREITKKKPVLVFKAGHTTAGTRATLSHTASLSGSDAVFDAMCKQAGIIRSRDATQTFNMAEALADQPLPPGKRIAILGSGGQGVVTADACEALGLEVPLLEDKTIQEIKKILPPHAPMPTNPIDFAGSLRTGIEESSVVETLLRQENIDGVISNVPINPMAWSYASNPGKIPKPLLDVTKLAIDGAQHFASLPTKYNKPIITIRFRTFVNDIVADTLKGAGIPIYNTPEECALAMYALARYGEIKRNKDEL
jgi:acetyltransferase